MSEVRAENLEEENSNVIVVLISEKRVEKENAIEVRGWSEQISERVLRSEKRELSVSESATENEFPEELKVCAKRVEVRESLELVLGERLPQRVTVNSLEVVGDVAQQVSV